MLEPVVCWMAANRMTPADFADLQLHLKAISDAIQANLPFETLLSKTGRGRDVGC